MLDKMMDYGMAHDLSVEDLIILHDEYGYATVIDNGQISDFVYEGKD